MAKYGEEVIVHVLGFSQHHNDAFLKDLSLLVSINFFLKFGSVLTTDLGISKTNNFLGFLEHHNDGDRNERSIDVRSMPFVR